MRALAFGPRCSPPRTRTRSGSAARGAVGASGPASALGLALVEEAVLAPAATPQGGRGDGAERLRRRLRRRCRSRGRRGCLAIRGAGEFGTENNGLLGRRRRRDTGPGSQRDASRRRPSTPNRKKRSISLSQNPHPSPLQVALENSCCTTFPPLMPRETRLQRP